MIIRIAALRLATFSAPTDAVKEDQIFRESVPPRRSGLNGLSDRFTHACGFHLMLVSEPDVYRSAAASPKPRPAARMMPVMILGTQAGIMTD